MCVDSSFVGSETVNSEIECRQFCSDTTDCLWQVIFANKMATPKLNFNVPSQALLNSASEEVTKI